MSQESCLIIEPTVSISIVNNDCFLYDTLSKNKIEFKEQPALISFLNKVSANNNVIRYSLEENSSEINNFVKLIKDHFMGDLIPINKLSDLPFQMTNIINIQRDESKLRTGDSNSLSIGEKIVSYLKELNILLNNQKNDAFLENAYNQFLYCGKNEPSNEQLDYDKLLRFLEKINLNELTSINLTGSDISAYENIDKFLMYLEPFKLTKNLFFHIDVFNDQIDSLKRLLTIINNKFWYNVVLFVHVKHIDLLKIKNAINVLTEKRIKHRFHFIIENEEDYFSSEATINEFKISAYSILPFYNKKNIDFFEKHIFLEKEDILAQELTLRKVNTLKKVNPNFFGKLYVDNSGNIFTNVNLEAVGHIALNSVADILHTELDKQKSWFDIKLNDDVCSNCVYNTICPPKSNYEYFFNKSNLCTVR
ncbi:TIGR04150 pseudo-rSAM protein [Tenacibaculum sp. FZY0031]|uniref:TIGR04150 pseudo-rSAM protein n=1 Tax=unclassified Tenacibaculum TaxID=2635139 RepID=UPI002EC7FBEF|nr:TIGR04150 pseudo-rSAM protein [Tenacibaculum sp. FZY0031]